MLKLVSTLALLGCTSAALSGNYHGTKSILGQNIDATVTIDDATHMDLVVKGAAGVDCKSESYSYDGKSTITLPNEGSSADCVNKALAKESLSLKGISYDSGKDEITVSIKKSFLSLSLVLSKVAALPVRAVPTTCTPNPLPLGELFERLSGLVGASTAPSGAYKGSKSVLGQQVDASLTIDDAAHCDFSITGPATISCQKEAYSYNSTGTITLPNKDKDGDCIHDALAQYSVDFKEIDYDAGKDEITVKVSALGLPVSFTLDKASPLEGLVKSQVVCHPSMTCKRVAGDIGACVVAA